MAVTSFAQLRPRTDLVYENTIVSAVRFYLWSFTISPVSIVISQAQTDFSASCFLTPQAMRSVSQRLQISLPVGGTFPAQIRHGWTTASLLTCTSDV